MPSLQPDRPDRRGTRVSGQRREREGSEDRESEQWCQTEERGSRDGCREQWQPLMETARRQRRDRCRCWPVSASATETNNRAAALKMSSSGGRRAPLLLALLLLAQPATFHTSKEHRRLTGNRSRCLNREVKRSQAWFLSRVSQERAGPGGRPLTGSMRSEGARFHAVAP